ncbi:colicin-like pore-forming protein [Pseudomonas sp. NPDC087614]|uniref:colicin-like pore-forming protein n=1 Tax=Pseudomonas sp. NPDC087614 TaxID=3364442 RepID=UPI0037FA6E96
MSQLELPGMIIYGDGSWEIINLNPDKIRGDIRKNYPLGNPMHGFTLALQNDYHARQQNLEAILQSELSQVDSRHPPIANMTPDAWLSRTLNIVNELLFQKNTELQQQLQTVKIAKQYAKLEATYNAMILNDQIANLQVKQTNLYAQMNRRQAEALAMQQAAEAVRQAQEARKQAHEQARLAAIAEAHCIAEEKSRIAAEEQTRQIDDYKRAVAYVADANKYILDNYGKNLHQVVMDLQKDISGKKIRSYTEAMQTFEKVRTNPNARLNALDKATYMDSVNKLAKGFGLTGKIVQAHSVVTKAVIGFQDGNWKPLMLEFESIAAGIGAGAILAIGAAFFFPTLAVSTPGIVAVGLLIAAVAAYLNAGNVEKINIFILEKLDRALPET